MHRKIAGFLIGSIIMSGLSYGAPFGGELAVGLWNQSPEGWVQFPDDAILKRPKIDVKEEMGLEDSHNFYLRGRIEHPIPVLPNLKLEAVDTEYSGTNRLHTPIVFGKTIFQAGSSIRSDVNLRSADATFYYNLVDSALKISIGLSARYIDGEVTISEAATALVERKNFSVVFPLIYANARLPIPLVDGLSVGAEGAWLSFDGNEVHDLKLDVRYIFTMGLGLETGYRYQTYTLDDAGSLSADIDQSGWYFGAIWVF